MNINMTDFIDKSQAPGDDIHDCASQSRDQIESIEVADIEPFMEGQEVKEREVQERETQKRQRRRLEVLEQMRLAEENREVSAQLENEMLIAEEREKLACLEDILA